MKSVLTFRTEQIRSVLNKSVQYEIHLNKRSGPKGSPVSVETKEIGEQIARRERQYESVVSVHHLRARFYRQQLLCCLCRV